VAATVVDVPEPAAPVIDEAGIESTTTGSEAGVEVGGGPSALSAAEAPKASAPVSVSASTNPRLCQATVAATAVVANQAAT